MNLTCPHCNTTAPIESITEDNAARALFGLLGNLNAPMIAYLGLFKPRKQALRWSRALSLATDALALCDNHAVLAAALIETVESMRERRQHESWKPLTSHTYLERVISSVLSRGTTTAVQAGAPMPTKTPTQSKTAQSIEILKGLESPEGIPAWFTRVICDAHIDMLLLGLDGTPASDVMELAANSFIKTLWPRRAWELNARDFGGNKLRRAIVAEAEKNRRWPTPNGVMQHIPQASTSNVWGSGKE